MESFALRRFTPEQIQVLLDSLTDDELRTTGLVRVERVADQVDVNTGDLRQGDLIRREFGGGGD